MVHIVVLGAGIGGMPTAFELRNKLDSSHRITVVNAVDYFQFVPSNSWLDFEEVPGSGPGGGFTHSICTVDHAEKTLDAYQAFLKASGPVIYGARRG